MENHEQVPTLVRVRVDAGIRPLVEALTGLDGIYTLESCQGRPGAHMGYVLFHAGELSERLLEFLRVHLGGELMKARLSARYDLFQGNGNKVENWKPLPRILLEVDPDDVEQWAERIAALAGAWNETARAEKPA